ncbi:MAG: nuclear transport factor 2 family protein [Candidatus Ryanbacteria bacterium]|nr:nuclear transport factor 2 family protein [Candidatus Ryanbacteria bacterium]
MPTQKGNLTKIVRDILRDEVRGDVNAALRKMAPGYSMTWVYQAKNGTLFPRADVDIKKELKNAYKIRGRKYDIKHVAEGKNVVFVELIESYPDSKTKKVFRTPLVLVLEMKGGKVARGRHYCDPRLSYMFLSKKQVGDIFKMKK